MSQPTPAQLNNAQTPPSAPQALPPAENPLDQLRDIHLPDPIDVFPYAPGWWILLSVLLLTVGYFIYRKIKYRRAIRLIIPARAELAQLRALSGGAINSHAIATLSALLKRVCLLYFNQVQVASLSGSRWLEFLNAQVKNHSSSSNDSSDSESQLFTSKDIQFFSQAAYQKSTRLEQADWLHLLDASEKCIESIIFHAARKQLSGGQKNHANLANSAGVKP
jgi:hypothetical protein